MRFWSWVFFAITFVVTLLIELPFVRWVMPPQGKTFGQVLKAAVTVNAISYALLFGWYWMASGTSMMTPLQVVPASSLVQGDEYELFFILKTEMAEGESAAVIGPTRLPASRVASPCRCNRCEPESLVEPSTTPSSSLSIPVSRFISMDGDQILKADLNGGRQSKLSEVRALHRNDRLFARRNATEGYDLWVYLDSDEGEGKNEVLIASGFSSFAPLSDAPTGAWFDFGKVPSLASDSDWEFRTGFWAAEGIKGTNKKTGDKVHYALETPYSMWNVRNATQIEGDMVVFQLGKSQICALHPESRRIALLARGKGPIVAKRGAAN